MLCAALQSWYEKRAYGVPLERGVCFLRDAHPSCHAVYHLISFELHGWKFHWNVCHLLLSSRFLALEMHAQAIALVPMLPPQQLPTVVVCVLTSGTCGRFFGNVELALSVSDIRCALYLYECGVCRLWA